MRRIREDVAALAAIERGSARPGELRSARWLARRLEAAGAVEVELQRYRYQRTYALAHGLHSLAGAVAIGWGGPAGALGAAGVLAS